MTSAHLGPVAGFFVGVAAAAVVGDWIAVAPLWPRAARGEYLCKPAAVMALALVALTLHPVDPGRRDLMEIALIFCLGGDVALMMPGERLDTFALGLGSFLVAQILFVIAFLHHGPTTSHWLLCAPYVVIAGAVGAGVVIRKVVTTQGGVLGGAVVIYCLALLAMATTVVAAGTTTPIDGWAIAGGISFLISDTLLALNRFVVPWRSATLFVHVTYHLAIGALVLSLLAGS